MHLLTYAACYPSKTGVIKLGYNAGVYGWNYDVYVAVKKSGVYHILIGHRNLPKGCIQWTGEDLEEILAAD